MRHFYVAQFTARRWSEASRPFVFNTSMQRSVDDPIGVPLVAFFFLPVMFISELCRADADPSIRFSAGGNLHHSKLWNCVSCMLRYTQKRASWMMSCLYFCTTPLSRDSFAYLIMDLRSFAASSCCRLSMNYTLVACFQCSVPSRPVKLTRKSLCL